MHEERKAKLSETNDQDKVRLEEEPKAPIQNRRGMHVHEKDVSGWGELQAGLQHVHVRKEWTFCVHKEGM